MRRSEYSIRLLQLGKTQVEMLGLVRQRGVRCARSELSEALGGVMHTRKGDLIRKIADEVIADWQREAARED